MNRLLSRNRSRADAFAAGLAGARTADGTRSADPGPADPSPLAPSSVAPSSVDAGRNPYAIAEGLHAVAVALEPVSAPRAEFRATLRTRLVAVASVQAATGVPAAERPRALDSAVSWSQSRRAQRGVGLAAGALASVVAVAGVAVAGSQSLPGDPFYGVKRGAEALELRTTHGAVAKGSRHLQFAAERLKEVRALSLGRDAAFAGPVGTPLAAGAFGSAVGTRVLSALTDMDRETRAGSVLLTQAYRDTNSDNPLQILSRFAGRQSRDLQALLPSLPGSTRPRAAQSLALVSSVGVSASQLLAVGVCTGQCSPTQAAPSLPPTTGGPAPQPAPTAVVDPPCGCPPGTSPDLTPAPGATPQPTPSPQPTTAPRPGSSAPAPQPSSSSAPLPVPLPTIPAPLPTLPPLPVPVPTITPLAAPGVAVPGLPAAPGVPAVPGVSAPTPLG
jgi:hypothetical protein